MPMSERNREPCRSATPVTTRSGGERARRQGVSRATPTAKSVSGEAVVQRQCLGKSIHANSTGFRHGTARLVFVRIASRDGSLRSAQNPTSLVKANCSNLNKRFPAGTGHALGLRVSACIALPGSCVSVLGRKDSRTNQRKDDCGEYTTAIVNCGPVALCQALIRRRV